MPLEGGLWRCFRLSHAGCLAESMDILRMSARGESPHGDHLLTFVAVARSAASQLFFTPLTRSAKVFTCDRSCVDRTYVGSPE
jgi:hypothetical protein